MKKFIATLLFTVSFAAQAQTAKAKVKDTCKQDIQTQSLGTDAGKKGYRSEVQLIDRFEILVPVESGIESGGERQVAYVVTYYDDAISGKSVVFASVHSNVVNNKTTTSCTVSKTISAESL
jgi:hypothetical protein